jgi:hypothetical protein
MKYRFLALAVNHVEALYASSYRGVPLGMPTMVRRKLCLKNRNLDEKCNRFKNGIETVRRLEPLALKGYTAAH